MRKPLAVVAALSAAVALTACGTEEGRIVGKNWQVIGIYTTPDAPSAIPETVAEVPDMVFGESTLIGTTGCTRYRAEVSYLDNNAAANIRDADTLRIDELVFDEQASACEGEGAWIHNRLTQILNQGSEYGMKLDPNDELILTVRDGQVDSPSLRLAAL